MDEREKRDAEINAALKGIESLINPPKTDDSLAPLDNANDDEIEELLALVGTSDVRVAKNIHINDRVEFAAQIEEIESKGNRANYYKEVCLSRDAWKHNFEVLMTLK